MRGLLHSAGKRNLFLGGVVFLLLIAFGMIGGKMVTFKMLPFDNKSEVEIVIDMPEGATLEETSKVTLAIGDYLKTVEEVTNFQLYAGIPAPFNFNGLVRHYYLREGSNVADIQVNLLPKHDRRRQSHDIAKAIRPEVQRIAAQYGANAKVVEVPPGPPVLSTLVAEIYGENLEEQVAAAAKVKEILAGTPGVVDVDWFVNDDQTQYRFAIKDKVRASGISEDQIVRTIRLLLSGYDAGALDQSGSLEGTRVVVRAPKAERTSLAGLLSYKIRNAAGQLVPLAELVEPVKGLADKQIDHKNLQRVIYVVADVAGKEESPVYAMLAVHNKIKSITSSDGQPIKIYFTRQPENEKGISLKWDGEWQITYEVFRDLGLAFAVGLIVMYLLIVGWFQSFVVPVVIMSPIPLTLTGIIPGHLLLGAFFTATSMIGFIALAGIIVRNSILLVEFAKQRTDEGLPLEEAVIEAGIVRAKPILLTAAAVMVGSFVILFDPIFQGMAISLIFGTLLNHSDPFRGTLAVLPGYEQEVCRPAVSGS
jgi:multidrug efflux pump subunit AcrB